MAADFQLVKAHYADESGSVDVDISHAPGCKIMVGEGEENNIPYLEPNAEEVQPEKEIQYDEDGNKIKPAMRYCVRVMLLSEVANSGPNLHLSNKLHFLVLKHLRGRATASCVGGLLDPEKDGEDLTTDEALKSAAVRHAKAQINVDLSGCDFHKFLELQYENGSYETRTVFVIPEIWKLEEPLVACTQTKEEEIQIKEVVEEEVELTEEEVEASLKPWNTEVEKLKEALEKAKTELEAAKEKEVEGETDEEKAAAETAKTAAVEEKTAAVTKAEEALKEKEEAKPEVPATRKVRKEQVKTKTVTQPILKPMHMSLHAIAESQQYQQKRADFDAIFEMKLFAASFDEMLRRYFGVRVLNWLRDYKIRKAAEDAERAEKRKKEQEEKEALEAKKKRKAERIAKKLAKEEAKKAAEKKKEEEAAKAAEKADAKDGDAEADGEAKEGEAEEGKPEETPEPAAEPEPEEDEEEEEEEEEEEAPKEPPAKPTHRTEIHWEINQEEIEPFLYFDASITHRTGHIKKDRMEALLFSLGDLCYREVQELLQPVNLHGPMAVEAWFNTSWHYQRACSKATEVQVPIPEPPAPKEESVTEAAEEGKPAEAAAEVQAPENADAAEDADPLAEMAAEMEAAPMDEQAMEAQLDAEMEAGMQEALDGVVGEDEQIAEEQLLKETEAAMADNAEE
jgi:hypothetical protein